MRLPRSVPRSFPRSSLLRDLALLPVAAAEVMAMRPLVGTGETVLYAATVGALFLRRRFPVTVLAAALPVTFTGHLLIAPMVALYEVARTRQRRTAAAWALVFFLASLGPWWPSLFTGHPLAGGILYGAVSSALMTAGPTAVGRLNRARRELARHIDELRRAHRREAELIAERAAVAERTRLAREMHDVVSYQVSLLTVQAGALQRTASEPAARETAGIIRELGATALSELRGLVGVLRSVPAETPRLTGLPALLSSSALETVLHADLPAVTSVKWPPAVEEAAYRTVQEALTNARKHAAGAKVTVTVETADRAGRPALIVDIHSAAGESSPEALLPSGGHGLTGLRERAEQLGGAFEAGPADDGGFRVRAVLPGAGGAVAARA
ncbi:histidine kinase [Streptomyces luteireticuli]|uniref:histidine kinase n=1 Tax=Streptomyces luteireticuli TaxID=173858 RepID=A0ABP3I3T4_9ACTN